MADQNTSLRECPTPLSGRAPLIAHQITPDMCAGRLAGLYHKCFSCAHFEGASAPLGGGALPAPVPPQELRPADLSAGSSKPVRPAEEAAQLGRRNVG